MFDIDIDTINRYIGGACAYGLIVVLILLFILRCWQLRITEEDKQAKKVVVFAYDMYTGHYGVRIYKYKDPTIFDVMWITPEVVEKHWSGRILYEANWRHF